MGEYTHKELSKALRLLAEDLDAVTRAETMTEAVNKLDAIDGLALLMDQVTKIRTVIEEVGYWLDEMPPASDVDGRRWHCIDADRAGIMMHIALDLLDDTESLIDRLTSELTDGCKCGKMGATE